MPDNPLVSNQADNIAKWTPQERLFYAYTQEMMRKRDLEEQLRQQRLDDEQGHEEEVQNQQRGTSNIMGMQTTGNNPGMKLFMGKIKGVRPKLLVPHPARARLPNAAQLNESVQTPLGIQKGSSGVLSTKQRKGMPKSSFAIPSKSPGSGSYPLPDASHARNALSRVSQFGSPAQKSQVRAAVHRKFPGIGKK